jgi:hypothetical protein
MKSEDIVHDLAHQGPPGSLPGRSRFTLNSDARETTGRRPTGPGLTDQRYEIKIIETGN